MERILDRYADDLEVLFSNERGKVIRGVAHCG